MDTDASMGAKIEQHFQDDVAGDEEAFSSFVQDDFVQEWPQSGERAALGYTQLGVKPR